LHHFTEFAGERYATTAFDQRCFDLKHLAADFSPCQSSGETNFTMSRNGLLAEFDWTQHFTNTFGINRSLRILVGLF
jgi:hypothetical protein